MLLQREGNNSICLLFLQLSARLHGVHLTAASRSLDQPCFTPKEGYTMLWVAEYFWEAHFAADFACITSWNRDWLMWYILIFIQFFFLKPHLHAVCRVEFWREDHKGSNQGELYFNTSSPRLFLFFSLFFWHFRMETLPKHWIKRELYSLQYSS